MYLGSTSKLPTARLMEHPELWLRDSTGSPVITGNPLGLGNIAWDFRIEEARQMWKEGGSMLQQLCLSDPMCRCPWGGGGEQGGSRRSLPGRDELEEAGGL